MKNNLLVVIALLTVFTISNDVNGQTNANPKIPPHLLPCYRNPEYYLRENRFPNNLRLFLDLIRTIENSRGGQQRSARELSTALLYHLRLDGIQQTPTVQQTHDITPFAPGGKNYYKHRLTLVGLLPKASRPSNYDFLNESLTQDEMCNLHFMLSYSVDPYKRDNEDCSMIKYEDGGGNRQEYDSPYYGYTYDSYRRSPGRRYRREAMEEKKEMRNIKMRIRSLRRNMENMLRRREALRESLRRKRSVHKEDNPKNPDVEIIPTNILESLSKSDSTDTTAQKGDFTLGHQEFLGPGEDHIMRGGYGNRRYPSISNDGGLHKRTAMYNGEQTSSAFIPGQPLSDCPIENGVIKTKYGSLTIGTVIAGIAAGFNHQKLSLSDFNVYLKGPLATERIDNIWATTLAGNAADLILSFGFINNFREGVGLRGGWDNLFKPRMYMLQMGKPNYLTDVELRGALDGLWLGLTIEKHKRSLGKFPLSSILEMYYSDDGFALDPKVKAYERGDQVTVYAPTEEFKKQVHLFAAVMENQRINKVTFSDFTNAVSETVAAINSYIPQLSPKRQTWKISANARMKLNPRTNIILIMDPNWEYNSLEYQIWKLIEDDLAATPGQSNLTIVCSFDGTTHPIPDSKIFIKNFNNIYTECKRRNQGINYQRMYRIIQEYFTQVLMEENRIRRIISQSQVALFMISESQRVPDPEVITEEIQNLRSNVPDIEIIVATNGPKERFAGLVISPDKDIFSIRKIDNLPDEESSELRERIARIPRKLSNPSCKYNFDNATLFEGDAELEDDIQMGRTVIYRLNQYHFYNSKYVKLSLRTAGQIVTVCQARQEILLPPNMQRGYNNDDPYPDNPTIPDFPDNGHDDSEDQQICKKGSNVVFDFENLCEDASSLEECLPLYISVQVSFQDKLDIKCVNCRLPTNVQYNIRISGLTSSAGMVIFSSSLLLLGYITTSLTSKLY